MISDYSNSTTNTFKRPPIRYAINYIWGNNATTRGNIRLQKADEPGEPQTAGERGFWARFSLALSKHDPSRDQPFQAQLEQNTQKLTEFQKKLLTLNPPSPQDQLSPQNPFTKITDSLQRQAQRVAEAGSLYYTTQQEIFDALLRDAEKKFTFITTYNDKQKAIDGQFKEYKNLITLSEYDEADIGQQNYTRLTSKILDQILVPIDLDHLESLDLMKEVTDIQTKYGERLEKTIKQTRAFLAYKEKVHEQIHTLISYNEKCHRHAPSYSATYIGERGTGKTPDNLTYERVNGFLKQSITYLDGNVNAPIKTTDTDKIKKLSAYLEILGNAIRARTSIAIAAQMLDPNFPKDLQKNPPTGQAIEDLQAHCEKVAGRFKEWNNDLVPVFSNGPLTLEKCINHFEKGKKSLDIRNKLNEFAADGQRLEDLNPTDYLAPNDELVQKDPNFWTQFGLDTSAATTEFNVSEKLTEFNQKLREFQDKLSPQDPKYNFTKIIASLQRQAQQVEHAEPAYSQTQQNIFRVLLQDAEKKLESIQSYHEKQEVIDATYQRYYNNLRLPSSELDISKLIRLDPSKLTPAQKHAIELKKKKDDAEELQQKHKAEASQILRRILVLRDLGNFSNLPSQAADNLSNFQTKYLTHLNEQIVKLNTPEPNAPVLPNKQSWWPTIDSQERQNIANCIQGAIDHFKKLTETSNIQEYHFQAQQLTDNTSVTNQTLEKVYRQMQLLCLCLQQAKSNNTHYKTALPVQFKRLILNQLLDILNKKPLNTTFAIPFLKAQHNLLSQSKQDEDAKIAQYPNSNLVGPTALTMNVAITRDLIQVLENPNEEVSSDIIKKLLNEASTQHLEAGKQAYLNNPILDQSSRKSSGNISTPSSWWDRVLGRNNAAAATRSKRSQAEQQQQ